MRGRPTPMHLGARFAFELAAPVPVLALDVQQMTLRRMQRFLGTNRKAGRIRLVRSLVGLTHLAHCTELLCGPPAAPSGP